MISIRKYLDDLQRVDPVPNRRTPVIANNLGVAALNGYVAALHKMRRCGVDLFPALGQDLYENLSRVADDLSRAHCAESVAIVDESVRSWLEEWGRRIGRHYQKKAAEVKDILLLMARTAESVGEIDQRCAEQINDVTIKLRSIADLEDLTQLRASIERSASELKNSIDRMTAKGKAALERLRSEVSAYQAKLEEVEQTVSRDALTRLSSRLWVEGQITNRIRNSVPFCAAILDIDGFKRVNDEHGHVVGDELLRQFSTELRSSCRTTDVVGRWGGDEFIVLLDCQLAEAEAQVARVRKWVSGNYTVNGNGCKTKLRVDASVGVAEHVVGDTMTELLDRADREMYRHKAALRDKTPRAAMECR